jgi:hypothetical protein
MEAWVCIDVHRDLLEALFPDDLVEPWAASLLDPVHLFRSHLHSVAVILHIGADAVIWLPCHIAESSTNDRYLPDWDSFAQARGEVESSMQTHLRTRGLASSALFPRCRDGTANPSDRHGTDAGSGSIRRGGMRADQPLDALVVIGDERLGNASSVFV